MQPKTKSRVLWTSIIVSWVFDLLFWKHNVGVSYLIMVVLVMVTGYFLARSLGIQPAKTTWLLAPLVLFFAAMTLFRADPLTAVVNVGFSIGLLALAAITYRGGKWWQYGFADYIAKGFWLVLAALSRLLTQTDPSASAQVLIPDETIPEKPAQARRRINLAVVRGIILALPIVLVLASLLASADPVFSQAINHLFDWFDIDKLGEYLFRLFYILVLAYLLAGTYLQAFFHSLDEKLIGYDKPIISSLIGWVESAIILGSINALFAVFVFIQFKYFFGGQGNIHVEGYTYAEYARKGFTEMVIVAVLSLLLLQVLSSITRRDEKHGATLFSGLSISLVGLVVVILVSAFQRLQLYEIAYGFSRIRLYSHIFMIWLGVLLVVTMAIELLQRQRAFALATLLCALGFGVTLNAISVDRYITVQNINNGPSLPLDIPYLVSLSDNNVPYLTEVYQAAATGEQLRENTGIILSCKVHQDDIHWEASEPDQFWGEYTVSKASSDRILSELKPTLDSTYPVVWDENQYSNYVKLFNERVYCTDINYMD